MVMIMVLFKVIGKEGEYPYVVLNGKNFYLKAQEVIHGSNEYREYATLNEGLENLKIEVVKIDIEKEEINKELRLLYNDKTVGEFHPIFKNTIDKHYAKIYAEQNFDFYRNMKDNYNVLEEIVFLVIYRNVTKEWVAAAYDLQVEEIEFILEDLPIYYNYLEFGDELWLI